MDDNDKIVGCTKNKEGPGWISAGCVGLGIVFVALMGEGWACGDFPWHFALLAIGFCVAGVVAGVREGRGMTS